MIQFFSLCRTIRDFDLASILRSIALPFVFLYIIKQEILDYFSQSTFTFKCLELPKPYQSPLFRINEDLQILTIKKISQFQSAPKRIKKQSLIDSYLELAAL